MTMSRWEAFDRTGHNQWGNPLDNPRKMWHTTATITKRTKTSLMMEKQHDDASPTREEAHGSSSSQGTLTTEEWKAETATGVDVVNNQVQSIYQFLSIDSILLSQERMQKICEQAKQL
jgi:hypothetical protein